MKVDYNPNPYGEHNYHLTRYFPDQVLYVELTYPENGPEKAHTVEINQEAVRASDGIRVRYDYRRDGFSIMQPFPVTRQVSKEESDYRIAYTSDEEEWLEVYFCSSWRFHSPESECDDWDPSGSAQVFRLLSGVESEQWVQPREQLL